MDGYAARLVAKVVGVPYSTLDYWARTKFITPSIQDAEGRGSRRLYSFRDVVALRVAKRLRDEGISLRRLRKVVSFLEQHFPEIESGLAMAVLVSDGKRVFLVESDQRLIDVSGGGQLFWAWPIKPLLAETRRRLAYMAKRMASSLPGKPSERGEEVTRFHVRSA